MESQNRNISMDFIRGVSALGVCAGHLRSAMFIDISAIQSSSPFEKLFYFVTSLGHEAVMVFFVLSGFFVGGAVVKKRDNFTFSDYLSARLSRLWTPLIPTLFLTLLFDAIVKFYHPDVLAGQHHLILNSGPKDDYSISINTFIINLVFLQTIYSPVFGTNGPLWSLAYEFWYYMFFPLLMIITGIVKKLASWRFIALIAALPIIYLIIPTIGLGFLVWLLGVGVYCAYKKNFFPQHTLLRTLCFLILVAFLINAKLPILPMPLKQYNDLFVGLAFSIFLLSIQKLETKEFTASHSKGLQSVFLKSHTRYTLFISHWSSLSMLFFIQKDKSL